MRTKLSFLALLVFSISCFSAEATFIGLTANQMSIATGQPSLMLMSNGSTQIPV